MAAKKQQESDKNLLFSKLLPALNENPFSADYEPEGTPIRKQSEEAAPLSIPPAEEEVDSLSILRSRLFARANGNDPTAHVTINVMESLVLKYIDQAIHRFNVCSCDRCKCDIAAYALNHLPPKYVVVSPSRIEQVEEETPPKLVMDALVNAVIQVRSKPRH